MNQLDARNLRIRSRRSALMSSGIVARPARAISQCHAHAIRLIAYFARMQRTNLPSSILHPCCRHLSLIYVSTYIITALPIVLLCRLVICMPAPHLPDNNFLKLQESAFPSLSLPGINKRDLADD